MQVLNRKSEADLCCAVADWLPASAVDTAQRCVGVRGAQTRLEKPGPVVGCERLRAVIKPPK